MKLAVLLLLAVYISPAFAYLDPGTGSIILQGLIASVAAMLAAGGVFWHRVKTFFGGLFSSNEVTVADNEHQQPEKN